MLSRVPEGSRRAAYRRSKVSAVHAHTVEGPSSQNRHWCDNMASATKYVYFQCALTRAAALELSRDIRAWRRSSNTRGSGECDRVLTFVNKKFFCRFRDNDSSPTVGSMVSGSDSRSISADDRPLVVQPRWLAAGRWGPRSTRFTGHSPSRNSGDCHLATAPEEPNTGRLPRAFAGPTEKGDSGSVAAKTWQSAGLCWAP